VYLKALTIKGFKSFADAATLEFEPGVSVIVGPNGSGKSNVVDAIGWVLGAQAPSAVRSQKMDDVIFAGTQTRPALGRAEVALTIDNTTGMLPVDFTEVRIARTLFRSGDSEYALNGVPCRLLDIQELLSDAGVGRQQHVIISQGNIDGVLNARPEDRRYVIEEAAGVLKYRRRREKAERRLAATESNLTRLADLVREVRRQLRPLERQADAARRHGALLEELTALRLHQAGREIHTLRARRDANRSLRAELATAERELAQRRATLEQQVAAAESELAAIGGDALGDDLRLFEALDERARGQRNLLGERRRGVDRERQAFVDRDVTATLEADAVAARAELTQVEADRETIGPELDALAADEAALLVERAAFDEELAEENAQPQLPLGGGGDASPPGAAGRGDGAVDVAQDELADAEGRRRLVERLAEALGEREAADDALMAADERRRAAESDERGWAARVDALALALDEARARAGADRLAAVEGFVGTLVDVVAIDEGWDAAFEAAVGEAISAVVVADVPAARRALATLVDNSMAGAVLALDLPGGDPPDGAPPAGASAVRDHVHTQDPAVSRLLDGLLARAIAVEDWDAAVDVAVDHPEAIVVTRDGARFGTAGWRVGAGSTQVTAAALDEARTRSAVAVAENREATVALASARSAAEVARRRELELSRQLGRAMHDARAALEARARELSARRTDLEVRQAGLGQRSELLERRLGDLETKLAQHAEQRAAAGERLAALEQRAEALDALVAFVEDRHAEIGERLGVLRAERHVQSEATRRVTGDLDRRRRERSSTDTELDEVRNRRQRAEIDQAEIQAKLEAAVDAVRRELEVEPDVAVAADAPSLPDGITASARIKDLERELRIMGPINPLALEEFEVLSERHEFLQAQLDDVKATRRELAKVIREVDHEIVNVFAAAFADVAANFQHLFGTLFPGGQGSLRLTDPDNMLETGIEVEAKPGGKNVKKLSLLSGGERSLTALAFLFAVFRSRPSPFYVMDEVEAALDDINLHRFLELIEEFRKDAQLVVVSHQKRTMEAADCLYGVSMHAGGSSKVVSERIDGQPADAAGDPLLGESTGADAGRGRFN
jgi:chromosome segregation protein